MKYISCFSVLFAAALMLAGCTDETLVEDVTSSTKEDFNIETFSEGYSLAFDMKVSSFGDNNGAKTRANTADITDADIEEWENHLDPEDFRILFFDSEDRFLFESRTRWFTQIPSQDGGRRWRVGVPVFQYLGDGFDEHVSDYKSSWVMDDAYNWDRIAEIMRTEPFKVAILANRVSDISIHDLSDFDSGEADFEVFGKNGPFWGPKNSRAYYDVPENEEAKKMIKTIFDLHHCQYDPYYENKNRKNGGAYNFIVEMGDEINKSGDVVNVAHMGAVSSWIHSPNRKMEYTLNDDGSTVSPSKYRWYFKLPKGIIRQYGTDGYDDKEIPSGDSRWDNTIKPDEDQYIPMYGLQQFAALKNWKKGTTYYLSEQSGSQTAEYDYKYIYLLRSVVKLELRIPMYENVGGVWRRVGVNNGWAQICGCNIMGRNEPMDVWSPTEDIWKADHQNDCEWKSIMNYGLYANNTTQYRSRLSWYFGIWDKEKKWNFPNLAPDIVTPETENTPYPRVFNPITQRVQRAMITDCYLPIENVDRSQCYHRWIVYCGERNMNDPSTVNDLTSNGYIATFRIEVTRNYDTSNPNTVIYNLPITDYSRTDNPIWDFYVEKNGITKNNNIKRLGSYPQWLERGSGTGTKYSNGYYRAVQATTQENWPYPLLRNHHYRLTMNFGNGNDIDVEVMNGEKRIVDGIEFN